MEIKIANKRIRILLQRLCSKMGNNQTNENLSPALKDKLYKIFRKFDTDGSKTIDKEETLKYWKTNFAKLNTDALFKAVDVDNSGTIEEEEWIEFWREVKRAGHSEKEIEEELENLNEGFSWVYFDKVPTDRRKKK